MPTSKPPKGRKTHKRKVPRKPIAPLSVSVSTETTSPPRLLARVRAAIRVRHFSPLTEKAYVGWIKRFIFFFDKRHPNEMGESEISAYVSHLATEKRVSASTQNQALSALLFLYRDVLGRELDLIEIARAKTPVHLPIVLTHEEAACSTRPPGRPITPEGLSDVWIRTSPARNLPSSRPGNRLRSPRDNGPQRKRRERPRNDVTAQTHRADQRPPPQGRTFAHR